ncbi:MAG: flagellar hook-basal body complex protein, partial [Planctomyces sp.]
MFTGLSGLNANARNLDVIGNNIANVNTTAYKSNRMLFASQFSRNLSLGTEPSENTGGSNPAQIGLGVTIAGTQRNFNTGSLAATGDQRDLAIEGDGFFVVQRGDQRFFTRAGAFRQNAVNDVVTVTGERLYGYGVDENFSLISGTLVPLNIPVGQMRLAEPTREVRFTGNLNAGGLLPTRSTNIATAALTEVSAGNPAITAATLMTDIDNPAIAGSQSLFSV